MDKNTFFAIFLSTAFLIVWFMFFQPKPAPVVSPGTVTAAAADAKKPELTRPSAPLAATAPETPEQEITIDTTKYKAVFTTRGAAVKHWYLKETNGSLVDLVLEQNGNGLSTFPGSVFTVQKPDPLTLVFTHTSPLGWQVTKTYGLSEDYLHDLTIELSKTKNKSTLPRVDIPWGPGLGTDEKELKENESQTRTLGYTLSAEAKLDTFKPGDYPSKLYKWAAVDNRYFLCALIPFTDSGFNNISVSRPSKKQPATLAITAAEQPDASSKTYKMMFYLGPKGHAHLKSLNLNLEETIDFGYFGFLGKMALTVLNYFYKMTGNYGWAIIILTVILQILVLPLTIKSFKASGAMKQLQPLVKELQEKYKADPKRLNVEMLNLYKIHKVNPLGGCLPMILQLPIFWALFTTLRNAFELRGAGWLLWVKDLSAPDTLIMVSGIPLNILPLIMGIGMFFQQQMMSVSTDPAQKQLMYLMPVIFTFMFWGFPSGLVIYWLTNSIMTMIEQYIIMKNQPDLVPVGK
jgi:YidC/Oxa1 family membrane protein insertase